MILKEEAPGKLKDLGRKCKLFRISKGYRLIDVAHETNYSVQTVSHFERGRDNNAIIFEWYVNNGYTGKEIE